MREVEIDRGAACLRVDGVERALRPKTFQVLLYLLEHRDRTVSKEEILEAVWPATAVTDDTLVQSIGEIRRIVGDDSRDSWFIRTMPRVGYRLFGVVQERAALSSGHRFPAYEQRLSPTVVLVAVAIILAAAGAAAMLGSRGVGSSVTARTTDRVEAYREYSLGLTAADGLRNTAALAHFRRALTLDRDFAMAEARIGYAYAVTWSLTEQAKPHFRRALEAGDRLDDRERLYVQGWSAIADRDFNGAIQYFRAIVARFPNEVEAYNRLGRLLVGEERCEEAIEVAQRGLIIDREAAELYNTLGGACSLLGRHAEAIAAHQRYVALRPREPNAHDSLAASYHWAGDYPRALGEYQAALRIDPRFEVARVHLAHAYWDLGRNREAIREMERYAATGPSPTERSRGFGDLFEMYRALGDRVRESGAAAAAIRHGGLPEPFALRMAIDRRDVAGLKKLEASPWLSGSARGARNPVRFGFVLRAEAASARGDIDAAIGLARDAVRHIPPTFYLDAYEDSLGDVLAAGGRHGEAIDEYRRILRGNPNRARTRYKLGLELAAAGRGEEARAELQRFVTIWRTADADAPELVQAKRRLGE
jgi:tetratricopeptide (TPR) repeat protein